MGSVNSVLNTIFNWLLFPFSRMNPWWGMIFMSLLTGLLLLLIFRLASDQKAIRLTKDRIKAHLLEFRLYKDSLAATGRAFGGILLRNLRYLGLTLKPLLVMIIPLALILIQLNARFGYRPLEPGEAFILKVKTAEGTNPLETDISIAPSSAYVVETPPLRIAEEREVNWRLRAVAGGRQTLTLMLNDSLLSKTLDVGPAGLKILSPRRPGGSVLDVLLNPGEKPLAGGSKLSAVEIAYPPARFSLFGLPLHWLLVFFALSMVFGLGLKGLFKVEI
ncbi:MAG: hypothetical protein JW747_00315 [Candidatus Aminicenantes bacterium]|nr:hypothetical protein [Candidatus Aminicenantes bacterium]